MTRALICACFLSTSIWLNAQIETGSWRLHVATLRAIDVATDNEFIYTAYENGLMRYHLPTKEKTMLTGVNGLSDILLSAIFYDTLSESLFIGYKNGNIDKYKAGQIVNIPAIKLSSISGSKKINRFYRAPKGIYVATDFGVVLINSEKEEVSDTYYPTNSTEPIVDIEVQNGIVFALSPSKLFFCNQESVLIPSPEGWFQDHRVPPIINGGYSALEQVQNELFVLAKSNVFGSDSVYKLLPTEYMFFSEYSSDLEISNLTHHAGLLDVLADGAVLSYAPTGLVTESVLSFYLGFFFRPNQMVVMGNDKWIVDDFTGLFRAIGSYSFEKIGYPGPPRNDYYALDWQKGRLGVASGRMEFKSPGFLRHGFYALDNEAWSYEDNTSVPEWQNIDIHDFIDISINPKNTDEMAVSTYSAYPVSVLNTKEGSCTVFDNTNSTLQASLAGNGWYLASDVCYDAKGNLWVLNGWSDRPLSVKKENNQWQVFDCGAEARNKYTTRMVIDYNDHIWFATETAGLFGYNYNNTLDNPSDDLLINLNTGAFSGELPSENVTAIAVDFDNEIWIGTDAGFAILYNSNASFNAAPGDYNAQRVKVRFEGNVEYVLGGTHITDIEVDGGNRKWVATASSGLVLLSADGSEIIKQFTKENSPLISNNVYDLKLNQETGELFIITDLGMVSYRTDATYEDQEYTSTKVFPNPVRPNYEGPITIQGIRYDSDVKVTDVAGNLVFKTTSNGGTATWDGRRLDGQKVETGVYLIWTATNEGSSRKVGKVVIIN